MGSKVKMVKYLGHYYDDERGGYVKVKEMEYRKKKFRVQFFYPVPKEYTFEESQELFLKYLEEVFMPTLKEQAIKSILEENRNEVNNKS